MRVYLHGIVARIGLSRKIDVVPPLKFSCRPPLLCAKNAGTVSPVRRKNVPVLPGSGLVFGYPQQKRSKTKEQVAAHRQSRCSAGSYLSISISVVRLGSCAAGLLAAGRLARSSRKSAISRRKFPALVE